MLVTVFKDTHAVTVIKFVAYDCVIIELQMYEHVFTSWTTQRADILLKQRDSNIYLYQHMY